MSLCNAPYDDAGWDCDPVVESWEEKKVRARKEHRCDECRGVILPGEEYGRATALVSGEGWQTMRRCACCLVAAEFFATEQGYCPLWGLLSETFGEHYDRETWDRFHPGQGEVA